MDLFKRTLQPVAQVLKDAVRWWSFLKWWLVCYWFCMGCRVVRGYGGGKGGKRESCHRTPHCWNNAHRLPLLPPLPHDQPTIQLIN
jgi:hypothetical protein